jgi:BMFP domain-containing protein YqiC
MQTENRLFDDFAKLLNGIAGTVAGAGREAEGQMRERMRSFMGGADFVGRDEFEAVKAMAAAARDEADALRTRLDALEGKAHEATAPTADSPPVT